MNAGKMLFEVDRLAREHRVSDELRRHGHSLVGRIVGAGDEEAARKLETHLLIMWDLPAFDGPPVDPEVTE